MQDVNKSTAQAIQSKESRETNEEIRAHSFGNDSTVIKLPQVRITRQSAASNSSGKSRPDSVILSDTALNVSKHQFGTHNLKENLKTDLKTVSSIFEPTEETSPSV